jgi:hypothetical protein
VVDTAVAGTHHNLIFAAHKLVTIAAAVRVVDHRYRARVNGATRHALRGMLTGEADRQWAREHQRGPPPAVVCGEDAERLSVTAASAGARSAAVAMDRA